MAIKVRSLGSSATTTQAINIAGSTNATPIVVTLTAGHGLRDGSRIAISGITGNTRANGIWTLGSVGATTATLLGSSGNGTHGGTVRVGVVFDQTPHMQKHAAALHLTGNHVGVVDIEAYASYEDFAAGQNNHGATPPLPAVAGVANDNGSSSTPAKSTLTTAATNPGFCTEMTLPFIARAVPTTASSGTFSAIVQA